jgi:hypothetical protein
VRMLRNHQPVLRSVSEQADGPLRARRNAKHLRGEPARRGCTRDSTTGT